MGTVLSPFGSLLAELRDERRPPRRGGAPPRPRPSVPVPEPKLLAFERRPAVGARLLPATALLHGAFAVAIVVASVSRSRSRSDAARLLRLSAVSTPALGSGRA